MRAMLLAAATVVGMATLACDVAVADTVSTNFESPTFHPGTVDLQDGWRTAKPTDIPALPHGYDEAVVVNSGAPPEFGGQSLRHSNAYNEATGEFFYQTYSKPTAAAAGEGLANKEFTAQFSFISTTPAAQQPGLNMTINPDSGDGGRMSYVGLRDVSDGIRVTVYDTPDPDGKFVAYDGGLLDRKVPHTIRFWMKLNPGADNDLVRIYIDGQDLGRCFTTWENFYRKVPEPVKPSNSLEFRSSGGEVASLVGGGYLFDNVTTTTADGAGPPGCDVPIDKTADSRTVSAGGHAGYQISVRNRGRLAARNVTACDHIPSGMTFVSADRKLVRVGRRRCLVIGRLAPGQNVSFHVVLRVTPNAPQGRLDNPAEIIDVPFRRPVGPLGGESPGLPAPVSDLPPGAVAKVRGAVKARAVARIIIRRVARARPRVTG